MNDITQHLNLVHHAISRYGRKYLLRSEYDDLFQTGCIGLLEAMNRFDSNRGVAFATYAVPMIVGSIMRYDRDATQRINVSRYYREIRKQIVAAGLIELNPTTIAATLNKPLKVIKRALATKVHISSIHQLVKTEDNERITVADIIPVNQDDSIIMVKEFIATLPPRDRKILDMVVNDFTQTEIGKVFGVTQTQISRRLKRIKEMCLHYFELNNPSGLIVIPNEEAI